MPVDGKDRAVVTLTVQLRLVGIPAVPYLDVAWKERRRGKRREVEGGSGGSGERKRREEVEGGEVGRRKTIKREEQRM